jgi:hypothetical protein
MKRFGLLALALVLGSLIFAGGVRAESGAPFMVHFTVIPAAMPDGTDAGPALDAFRKEVIALAGGYTELGPSQGGSMHPDGVHLEKNIPFVIGADRDVSVELKAMVMRLFATKDVFILTWPGRVTF